MVNTFVSSILNTNGRGDGISSCFFIRQLQFINLGLRKDFGQSLKTSHRDVFPASGRSFQIPSNQQKLFRGTKKDRYKTCLFFGRGDGI